MIPEKMQQVRIVQSRWHTFLKKNSQENFIGLIQRNGNIPNNLFEFGTNSRKLMDGSQLFNRHFKIISELVQRWIRRNFALFPSSCCSIR